MSRNVEALTAILGKMYPDLPLKVPEYSSAMSCELIAQRLAARGVAVLTEEEKAARRAKGEEWE